MIGKTFSYSHISPSSTAICRPLFSPLFATCAAALYYWSLFLKYVIQTDNTSEPGFASHLLALQQPLLHRRPPPPACQHLQYKINFLSNKMHLHVHHLLINLSFSCLFILSLPFSIITDTCHLCVRILSCRGLLHGKLFRPYSLYQFQRGAPACYQQASFSCHKT